MQSNSSPSLTPQLAQYPPRIITIRARVACAQSLCRLAICIGKVAPPNSSAQMRCARLRPPGQSHYSHVFACPVCRRFHCGHRAISLRKRQSVFLFIVHSSASVWHEFCVCVSVAFPVPTCLPQFLFQLCASNSCATCSQQFACHRATAIRVPIGPPQFACQVCMSNSRANLSSAIPVPIVREQFLCHLSAAIRVPPCHRNSRANRPSAICVPSLHEQFPCQCATGPARSVAHLLPVCTRLKSADRQQMRPPGTPHECLDRSSWPRLKRRSECLTPMRGHSVKTTGVNRA
jgi:hypothetical protein